MALSAVHASGVLELKFQMAVATFWEVFGTEQAEY